ncbi:MAG TPA: family 1 encapsulin nanocompartment shell protein, partial [Dongiaceae bacterium]|nr:family 1 encapsulin nanocompartment shell protein [Dongiaceae bacterium]
HLLRALAPLTEGEWKAIDEEARQTLKMNLAARRLVDFSGPHGWQTSSINLGRIDKVERELRPGVEARRRRVQTLIELRAPFELPRRELEIVSRGGRDPDLKPVTEAARTIAIAENQAVFNGFEAGSITGILEAAHESALTLTDDYVRYPEVVAAALGKLRNTGVAGPYGIALGPRLYTGLTETTDSGGYRVYDHVKRLLNGPVVWSPGIDGAIVVSMRGGDFELTVGEDFSIGYLSHSADTVRLYLQESLTFRVLTAEAAIPLRYRQGNAELAPPARKAAKPRTSRRA